MRQLADHVTVLRGGRVAESAPVEELFDHPQADYTRQLLASIPVR